MTPTTSGSTPRGAGGWSTKLVINFFSYMCFYAFLFRFLLKIDFFYFLIVVLSFY